MYTRKPATNCDCLQSILMYNGCSFYNPRLQLLQLSSVLPSTTKASHTSLHLILPLKHEHKWDLPPLLQDHEIISSKNYRGADGSLSHSMVIVLFSLLKVNVAAMVLLLCTKDDLYWHLAGKRYSYYHDIGLWGAQANRGKAIVCCLSGMKEHPHVSFFMTAFQLGNSNSQTTAPFLVTTYQQFSLDVACMQQLSLICKETSQTWLMCEIEPSEI